MVEEATFTFTGIDDWITENINDFDFLAEVTLAVLLAGVCFFPDTNCLVLVIGTLFFLLEDFDGVALEVDFVLFLEEAADFDCFIFLADGLLLIIVWPPSSTDFSKLSKNFQLDEIFFMILIEIFFQLSVFKFYYAPRITSAKT